MGVLSSGVDLYSVNRSTWEVLLLALATLRWQMRKTFKRRSLGGGSPSSREKGGYKKVCGPHPHADRSALLPSNEEEIDLEIRMGTGRVAGCVAVVLVLVTELPACNINPSSPAVLQ